MTCKQCSDTKQFVAEFVNGAIKRGLVDMSAVPGFACPTLITAGGAQPGTFAYRAHIEDATNATIYSGGVWNGVAIGPAGAARYVYLGIFGGGSNRTVSSVTIGGVSATLVTDGTDTARLVHNSSTVEFWVALVPTGTTANIVITWSGAQDRCGAGVWSVDSPKTIQAVKVITSNGTTPASGVLTTQTNGCVLAAHGQNGSGTATWTNVTEHYDATVEASATHTGADATATGASITPTVAFTGSPTARMLVAISIDLRPTVSVPARILDGYSNVTGAWSMSRSLLASFADGVRYTTETGVDSIKDQTGGGRHFANTTDAEQPAAATSGTRTAARFDGINDQLLSGSAASNNITASTGYIIACAKVVTVTTNDAVLPSNNDAIFETTGQGFYLRNDTGAYYWNAVNNDGTQDAAGTTQSYINQVGVFEWRHEGGTIYGRLTIAGNAPGAWQSAASGNSADLTNGFSLGGSNGAPWTEYDFFEMVTFNAIPNDTLKDALVTNMLAHYG